MKRRMKLFTSIASLSLAVALLVGGVAASLNRTATINGKVSFTGVQVDATVSIYEAHALTVAETNEIVSKTFVAGSNAAITLGGLSAEIVDESEEKTAYTYSYLIKVVNSTAGSAITATYTLPTLPDNIDVSAKTGNVLGSVATDSTGVVNIDESGVGYILITFVVDSDSANISITDFSNTVVLARA